MSTADNSEGRGMDNAIAAEDDIKAGIPLPPNDTDDDAQTGDSEDDSDTEVSGSCEQLQQSEDKLKKINIKFKKKFHRKCVVCPKSKKKVMLSSTVSSWFFNANAYDDVMTRAVVRNTFALCVGQHGSMSLKEMDTFLERLAVENNIVIEDLKDKLSKAP